MTKRLIDIYPTCIRSIIMDYLYGEKSKIKFYHKWAMIDLLKLITNFDNQKYISLLIQYGDTNRRFSFMDEDPRSKRHIYMYNECLTPASLCVIFKRIKNKKRILL